MELEELILKSSPYLKEARKRFVRVMVVFAVFFVIGFIFFRQLVDFFFQFFNLGSAKIIFTSPFQVFSLAVNTGLFLAIIFSAPFFLYQLIGFVKPALKKEERKLLLPTFVSAVSLFLSGFLFGFILMRWVVFEFASSFPEGAFDHLYDIELFLSQVLVTPAFLGLIFEFPLVIYFLVRLNLVDIMFLEEKRPWVIAGTFILVALLPPADSFSLIMMVLPVLLLFEVSLLLLKRLLKRKGVKSNVW